MNLIPLKQEFYSNSGALTIELSVNAIFFIFAPATGKKNSYGLPEYDRSNQKTGKLSISELTWLKKGFDVFYSEGVEKYEDLAMKYNTKGGQEKSKLKNIRFPHNDISFGLNVYQNRLQIIYSYKLNGKSEIITYTIQKQDIYRLERFIEKVIDEAFYYESFMKHESWKNDRNKK